MHRVTNENNAEEGEKNEKRNGTCRLKTAGETCGAGGKRIRKKANGCGSENMAQAETGGLGLSITTPHLSCSSEMTVT